MSIPLFLAMTGEDIQNNGALPTQTAWMACHFSFSGNGLTGIPNHLPEGSMLILDDRIPANGHDPSMIAAHLIEVTEKHRCSHILLDMERPPTPETEQIIRHILRRATCPVGVAGNHAYNSDCPVFLPSVPPHLTVEAYLSPWSGREIWLELALDGSNATVTPDGCTITPIPYPEPKIPSHHSEELHSHYHIDANENQILFSFYRTQEDLSGLLTGAEHLGVTLAVGLYQELGTQKQLR